MVVAMFAEMIHTASLVHDDVIDNSDMRRGQPSVFSVWGKSHYQVSGDSRQATAVRRQSSGDSRQETAVRRQPSGDSHQATAIRCQVCIEAVVNIRMVLWVSLDRKSVV